MATKQCIVPSKADRDPQAVQDAHKADDAMRQHWNDAVCKEFGVPSHYQSVAVLLIHWAKHLDTQLRCGEEVGVSKFQAHVLLYELQADSIHRLPSSRLSSD